MAFLTSFTIAYLGVPPVIRVSSIRGVFDIPDERKIHKNSIPSLGGVAMFAAIFFSILFWTYDINFDYLRWIVLPLFIVFLQGLKDDIVPIHAVKKLVGQLVATGILVFWGGVRIESLYGLLGIYELPLVVSLGLTFVAVAGIINSFNLIDGVDGLAGTIGTITTITFGTLFFLSEKYALSIISFTLTGALLGFLVYNFSPAKIFMGDGGALVIGMVLGILCVRLLGNDVFLNKVIPLASPSLALAILIVPLTDTLRVFTLRIMQGKSPFHPDRNHLHHVLLKLGFNHRKVALTLGAVNILFIILALSLMKVNVNISFGVIVAVDLAILFILHQLLAKKERMTTVSPSGTTVERQTA
jgi:UDP-N-acetylmuramyl pentapeptide phosphotransferase/UDP-N-acetylglucosamine-1-phosphate transferase